VLSLAVDLLASAHDRLQDLESLLESLTGRLAATAETTRSALNVFDTYRRVLARGIAHDWERFDDAEDRVRLLRFYLRDIGARLEELEEWFAAGVDASVPPALVDAVEGECARLLTSDRRVILAVGPPDNMATLVDELTDVVFESTKHLLEGEELTATAQRFALIQLSRFEANNPIWRPLIVGHEVAHLALLDRPVMENMDLDALLDPAEIAALTSLPEHYENLQAFPELAMQTAAEDWLEELICDAYALRRFGPAAVAALGRYFEQIGGTSYGTHPPGWFRLQMMLRWLGEIEDPELHRIVEPWALVGEVEGSIDEDWARYLVQIFTGIADDIPDLLGEGWPEAYDAGASAPMIKAIADELCQGIPQCQVQQGGEAQLASDADIVNAGWLARTREHPAALYRLIEKALEIADFLQRWQAGGGVVDNTNPVEGQAPTEEGGLLTEASIRARYALDDEQRLAVSPLLARAIKETGLDVRLGRHFIVFQRASTSVFDPLLVDNDPRTMQRAVERRWGEPFVLHPGELVLAATFEYFALPHDVGAQVITRSSYGRLGLITATAIQVHPGFRGCLTLELVNLGALPIALYPGERVAQLTLTTANPPLPVEADKKYDCPTKPEFSRVGKDWDLPILRAMLSE